ncbi:uncharacterized protein KY384_004462 [Bacidia gigantensis]|uniref:uncharacterized protein n=1 Tax=Bacidia gigantensis TaxID=2732470 RepID=UPI001D050CC5|nr:uncharacterized protein KY384_004462 [Bacidia gigantensis]KAG8531105.1 hypothetical protein KY384_004462 [Bacidia gigantensis]
MFTTAAQLLDLTDKKLVLVLRDGRKITGILRSWDQFANLVLSESQERIYARTVYAVVPRGIFLVRGENVLLLGEIDLDKDDHVPESYRQVSEDEAKESQKQEQEDGKREEKSKARKLARLGFEAEHAGEMLL